jgi:CBS domain-containing protein
MIPKSLVVYINVGSTARQALEKMNFHRYSAVPVLDAEGKYIATLRNDDIFGYFLEHGSFDKFSLENIPVEDLLDRNYSKPVAHNTSMRELIESVKEHNFVPVVDDRGCFIGIVLRREILNYLLENLKEN